MAGLDIEGSVVHVLFADQRGRVWLTYVFSGSTQHPGILFIEQSGYKEFDGEGDEPRMAEHMSFFEDGRVYSTSKDHVEQTLHKREGTKDDLSLHYEPLPEFGDYASLLREDRSRSVEDQDPGSPALIAAASPIA